MQITITTTQLDASVALKAYKSFKDADYQTASSRLLEILDVEPQNWQARLMLAVCYHKMGQQFASERALRFVYNGCPDSDLKQKACLALQSLAAHVDSVKLKPVEFGRFNSPHQDVQPMPMEVVLDIK
jgi:thioredoxin-like negative regulator of GroEL